MHIIRQQPVASSQSKPPIVELTAVSKRFHEAVILDQLNLQVLDGEFLTILGPSGCGKTTLLRLIAGLEQPESGQLYINGQLANQIPPEQRQVNMVFQHYALFPHLSIFDNVAFGLRCKHLPKNEIKRRVEAVLAMVCLQPLADRKPEQLSGGQRQRVAIARAAVNEPLVLLLDEPLSALDYRLKRSMQLELQQLQRRLGITFIMVTHDQQEALSLSDRVVVMQEGHIAQIGTPKELYEEPNTLFVAKFIGEANIFQVPARVLPGGAQLQIELEGQSLQLSNHRLQLTADQLVYLMIRPEDIDVWGQDELDAAAKSTAFPGVVEQVIYKGSTVDLIVRLASGATLAATEFFNDDADNLDYKIGEPVWVNWIIGWEVLLLG